MRFEGKTGLVTGSGRGIGRAIALKLASEGADVVINFFRTLKAPNTARIVRSIISWGTSTHGTEE